MNSSACSSVPAADPTMTALPSLKPAAASARPGAPARPGSERALDERRARLRATSTLAGDSLARWCASRILVAGAGNLGARYALEVARSGASVHIVDPDRAQAANLGTSLGADGVPKVEALIAACDAIQPGLAGGSVCDVLHAGLSEIVRADLLVDSTDDADLALPLTQISNGLGVPLLRLALDGSGQRELGRVLVSHGAGGHACQICSYSLADLQSRHARTACPGAQSPPHRPTLAGGALGMAVAGLGLLQSQRLLGGRDIDLALDREILLDLNAMQCLSLRQQRSEACLSGHRRWQVLRLPAHAVRAPVATLFEAARDVLGGGGPRDTQSVVLEPFAHPLCLEAVCSCGGRVARTGTRWAATPVCPDCGAATSWRTELQIPRFDEAAAAELGISETSLQDLGLPEAGALVAARLGTRTVHLLID